MKMLLRSTVLFLALALTTSHYSFAHVDASPDAAKWEKLGSRKVKYTVDRDEIPVTIRDGRFSAIKLVIKKAPIDMMKCIVYFGDGKTQEIALRKSFKAGDETRIIDLDGDKRVISKVVLWYDTKNAARKRATVELWGRR